MLGDQHPDTVQCKKNVEAILDAQGKDLKPGDRRNRAVKSLDATRLRATFTGL
jgi:hypothetical protein